jgi:hypothetical protein
MEINKQPTVQKNSETPNAPIQNQEAQPVSSATIQPQSPQQPNEPQNAQNTVNTQQSPGTIDEVPQSPMSSTIKDENSLPTITGAGTALELSRVIEEANQANGSENELKAA